MPPPITPLPVRSTGTLGCFLARFPGHLVTPVPAPPGFFSRVWALVLLCHKRRPPQNEQYVNCLSRNRASRMRGVAIEPGLCRSARTRRAARDEVGRKFRGA